MKSLVNFIICLASFLMFFVGSVNVPLNAAESAKSELISTDSELSSPKNEHVNTEGELISIESELSSPKNELVSAEGEFSSTKNELISTESELLSTEGELVSTESELLSTEGGLVSTESELLSAESELSSTESELLSPEEIFTKFEKRTELVDSIYIKVLLTLSGGKATRRADLRVKGPDKFAAEFHDKTVAFYFNGTDLWLYMPVLNEAFYYSVNQDNSFFEYLSFFKPKKLFTSLTKSTLFALFDIQTIRCKDNNLCGLKFVPIAQRLVKKIFSIGYYNMYFSKSSCLPVEAIEFNADGKEVGRLKVITCEINKEISDEKFNFTPPPGTDVVPVITVIKQKIAQSAEAALEKAASVIEAIKNKLFNRSGK